VRWMTGPGSYCSPRHRVPFVQATRVQSASDNVASSVRQALPGRSICTIISPQVHLRGSVTSRVSPPWEQENSQQALELSSDHDLLSR